MVGFVTNKVKRPPVPLDQLSLIVLCLNNSNISYGHHKLGLECKNVQAAGLYRMLAGKRVGVDLARNAKSPSLCSLLPVEGASK